MLTAHELIALAPTLSDLEPQAFFDHASKAVAIFFPALADHYDTDIHDVGMSVSFAAALEGRYEPITTAAWPALRQEGYTARTLGDALPRVLRKAAVQAYSKHLDDLEYFCTSRLNHAHEPEQKAHLKQKIRDVEQMRAEFVERIRF